VTLEKILGEGTRLLIRSVTEALYQEAGMELYQEAGTDCIEAMMRNKD